MPTLQEVALIFFIFVIVFGISWLSPLGDALGRGVNRLRGRRREPPQDPPAQP